MLSVPCFLGYMLIHSYEEHSTLAIHAGTSILCNSTIFTDQLQATFSRTFHL